MVIARAYARYPAIKRFRSLPSTAVQTFGRASMWRIVSPAKRADYRGALLIELHNA
jgi:hypothetical protein